jgi:hypothetical protein
VRLRRRSTARWRPRKFELNADTRQRLAQTIRRRTRFESDRIQKLIADLEPLARDFFEATPFAVEHTNSAMEAAMRRLERARRDFQAALRDVPQKARTVLLEKLIFERSTPAHFLSDLEKNLTTLGYALRRVEPELAASRRPGRPSDDRGQVFAYQIAAVLQLHGVPPTKYRDGLFAECLELLFGAVEHPLGDLGTLLSAAVDRVEGKALRSF